MDKMYGIRYGIVGKIYTYKPKYKIAYKKQNRFLTGINFTEICIEILDYGV